MEHISLKVVDTNDDQEGRVNLHDDDRTSMGVLAGEKISVESDDQSITLQAWQPDLGQVTQGSIPLTEAQRRQLGVEEGSTVSVSPTTRGSEVFDGSTKGTSGERRTLGSSSSTVGANQQSTSGSSDGEESGSDTREPVTDVNYSDVGGLDQQLQEIREAIELPLRDPDMFEDLGIDPPKGVLMYGPPGTGKTLIGKAVANEVDATFLNINGPEVMSKYKGESEKKLREVFAEARQEGDAVIFFDEIDSFASQREDGDDSANRVVSQLLSLMDGMDSQENVVVIGSTNRADSLDPALRRGGRFDREVEVGVPDEDGRKEVFDIHTRKMPLDEEVEIKHLAERTHGFVGADIATVCREAGMEALRRYRNDDGDVDRPDEGMEVTMKDFNKALSSVEPSAMREFVAETPDVSFDDVGGLEDAKTALKRNIEWPLHYNDLFDETGTDPAPGVLIHGESGTGKTFLARALAGESDVNFIHVNSTELLDKYVGESEKAVREVFQRARQAAPSIIFLDDLDGVADKNDDTDATNRIASQISSELDAIRENPQVTAVAAVKDKDRLDDQLVGPGQFEEMLELTPPGVEERKKIFNIHAEGKPLGDDVDLEEMAKDLEGSTGGDIESIVREASMIAIEESVDDYGSGEEAAENADEIEITNFHFEAALQNLGHRDS